MKTDIFPVNYLRSTLSPVRAFLGRKQLSWPKNLFVILFLNALLMIPIVLSFNELEWSLDSTFPAVYRMIDDEVVEALQKSKTENGTVTFEEPFRIIKGEGEGEGAGGFSGSIHKEILAKKYALVFMDDEFIIKEDDAPLSVTPYTKNVNWDRVKSPDELKQVIEQEWFRFNRVYLVGSYSFLISAMLLVMNVILIFGSSFFVHLSRRSSFEENTPFKESLNLMLNAMGMPVFLAFIFGIFNPDVTVIMTIQTLGLVLMLVAIYFQTHFSETYLLLNNS